MRFVIINKNHNKRQEYMKKDQFYRILDDYSYVEEEPSFGSIDNPKQFANVLHFHIFEGELLRTGLSDHVLQQIPARLDGLQSHLLNAQHNSLRTAPYSQILSDVPLITVEDPRQNQPPLLSIEQKDSRSKSGDSSKPRKNQYDKNIFGNISKTVLKQMMSGDHEDEIRNYCIILGVDFLAFLNYFGKMDRECIRMGTSELNHLLHSQQISLGFRKVFSYFFVRYLREEYLGYVLQQGRMKEKTKYLRCASKMMYIPQLTQSEYRQIGLPKQPQNI